ncbi:MAG: TIGR01777 family oxidoreductase [Planctomycetota bacterium]
MQQPPPDQDTRRVVIAGGSGFLGMNLARWLVDRAYAVTILSRSMPTALPDGVAHVPWDGRTLDAWADALQGASGLVNLAGRTVDCVKTPDHCDEILRSRVESTRILGAAMQQANPRPPVWVQMSTAHRYGDPPHETCTETSAFGDGLAPRVGAAWEQAFHETVPDDVRPVVVRTSFVLGHSGGALPRLAWLARIGLGGRVGHGRQGISWIHKRDMNRLFERALTDESMRDAYIATAPNPVSNAEFMRTLRRAVRRPIGLPAMAWMVRIGAPLVLRTDPELALYGRYCVSQRLKDEGFEFDYPDVQSALADLYRSVRNQ